MMDGMTDTPIPPTMTGAEFGQALAELDWKQVDFAARAGVAADTVNRWIHDRQPIPAWAVAHVRLLLAGRQFYAEHVAPPPRVRRKTAAADQVAPDTTDLDAQAGMNWWNRATEAERREWCARAGSALPADAWAAFKASIAGSQT
jgi:DNA-binding transcriptional regulator YdaS (Cro superfamily)